jgi:thymidylate synthase (FAD)
MTPRCFILGRPQFEPTYQQFLNELVPPQEAAWREDSTATSAERLVEFAGRVCYLSFGSRQSGKTTREYIRNLIRNGHESVLEHAVWTLGLCGVSRAFSHQLVRHRTGFSYSQLSQQYHDESDGRFVKPQRLEQVPAAAKIWEQATASAQKAYREMLVALDTAQGGEPSAHRRELLRELRSAARSVLPNASETALVITANARALRHFLRVRGATIGDTEMRCVSAALYDLIQPEGPALFEGFSRKTLPDGLPVVEHRNLV